MPSPVKRPDSSAQSSRIENSNVSKKTPLGISNSASSVRSLENKKDGFFQALKQTIKNCINAIFNGIKNVFFALLPFKSIFVKKREISETEKRYYDYQKKLYRVDSLSTMLANKEAYDLLPYFNAYEKLDELELKKQRSIFSFLSKSSNPPSEEKVKIGKDIAKKSPPLELIEVLKEYYTSQIPILEEKLKLENES